MMRHGFVAAACLALAVGTFACADKKTTPKGATGENCAAAKDCGKGLACVNGVCVDEGLLGGDAGGDIVTQTRGEAGESCTRRGDCQAGLACIEQVCVDEGSDPEGSNPGEAGGRNETCVTHADCKSGLGCYASRCREKDADLTVTGKSCVLYQCQKDADCCETFVPEYDMDQCALWKDQCDNGIASGGVIIPSPNSCTYYNSWCVCEDSCIDNQCIMAECTVDGDCGLGEVCSGNLCRECDSDDDCTDYGAGFYCNEVGNCQAGCVRDEQCGTMEQCKDGVCEYVGCTSDLQCKAMGIANAQLATCVDGDCVVPCEADAECGSTQKCQDSKCTDLGCSDDTECRYLLGIGNTASWIAVCIDEAQ